MGKYPPVFDPVIKDLTIANLSRRGYTTTTKCTHQAEIIVGEHSDGLKRFHAEAISRNAYGLSVQGESQDVVQIDYTYIAKKKSSKSGYTALLRTSWMRTVEEINNFFVEYDDIVGSIDATGYPRPCQFVPHTYQKEVYRDGHKKITKVSFTSDSQIKTVSVLSLVTINRGFNTVDITGAGIMVPNTRCWFLLECIGFCGAGFNLISDGQEFYPVERTSEHHTRTKICYDVKKATVSIDSINQADQNLIELAIAEWIERHL